MKSIIQRTDRCYLCQKCGPLHTYYVFGSTEDNCGLTVRLCRDCLDHVDKYPEGLTSKELRRHSQRKAMEYYGWSEDEFRQRYGRSVL